MLLERLDQLLAYFSRRVMDVPDGLFDRNTELCLNGVPYETLLGRSSDDPLVRLIARGPAGYRFAAQALLHALEPARATLGEFEVTGESAKGTILLEGALRGETAMLETLLDIDLEVAGATIKRANVRICEEAVSRIREARNA